MFIDTLFPFILNKGEKERAINARPFSLLIVLCKIHKRKAYASLASVLGEFSAGSSPATSISSTSSGSVET